MPDRRAEKPGIAQLFRRLFEDGAQVVEVEFALAKMQAQSVLRRYLMAAAIALFGFAVASVSILVIAEGIALAVMPYVSNPAFAYLGVGLFLLLIGAIALLVAVKFVMRKPPPVGFVAKWLSERSQ